MTYISYLFLRVGLPKGPIYHPDLCSPHRRASSSCSLDTTHTHSKVEEGQGPSTHFYGMNIQITQKAHFWTALRFVLQVQMVQWSLWEPLGTAHGIQCESKSTCTLHEYRPQSSFSTNENEELFLLLYSYKHLLQPSGVIFSLDLT